MTCPICAMIPLQQAQSICRCEVEPAGSEWQSSTAAHMPGVRHWGNEFKSNGIHQLSDSSGFSQKENDDMMYLMYFYITCWCHEDGCQKPPWHWSVFIVAVQMSIGLAHFVDVWNSKVSGISTKNVQWLSLKIRKLWPVLQHPISGCLISLLYACMHACMYVCM